MRPASPYLKFISGLIRTLVEGWANCHGPARLERAHFLFGGRYEKDQLVAYCAHPPAFGGCFRVCLREATNEDHQGGLALADAIAERCGH